MCEIEKLRYEVESLKHMINILLIDDSPIFEQITSDSSRSNDKRIILVLSNLIEREKYVMITRMIKSVVNNIQSKQTLSTMSYMIKAFTELADSLMLLEERNSLL